MIAELLERAVKFFRLGRATSASVSFETYLRHDGHRPHELDALVIRCINVGDYLRAADIIAYGIAPLYA